ncbi:MAG: 4-hydroxy-tetrahydrodipicolinate synthase, partial [Firmicutes bacterium]|nr:4-hydroxy-tetrahydrodipicolinate synthase [Bacillota bacterium]
MIKGSMVALVTPFTEDGSVNFKRVRELVEWHIQEGTDAILVLGTTAETPTLTTEEEDEIVRIAIEQNAGRVPIVVGSGSNNTAKAIETSLKYEKMGADALLVISPYYNKANKQGMIQHFLAVADAVNTPIILYNVPARTGISISYEVLEAVCKHKNIVGIKEASGDMSLVSKFSKLIDDNFTIYSGNDDINVPLMSLGGGGVISVLANILPGVSHDMAAAALEGDFVKAREIQIKYMDLINALFIETNPIPVKEAMNMLGLEAGGYRLPLYPMEEKN